MVTRKLTSAKKPFAAATQACASRPYVPNPVRYVTGRAGSRCPEPFDSSVHALVPAVAAPINVPAANAPNRRRLYSTAANDRIMKPPQSREYPRCHSADAGQPITVAAVVIAAAVTAAAAVHSGRQPSLLSP